MILILILILLLTIIHINKHVYVYVYIYIYIYTHTYLTYSMSYLMEVPREAPGEVAALGLPVHLQPGLGMKQYLIVLFCLPQRVFLTIFDPVARCLLRRRRISSRDFERSDAGPRNEIA